MAEQVKTGIFGGTFDPVHLGHLAAANEVRFRLGLDKVVFVPAGQPWQKAGRAITAGEHRLAMLAAATASNPFFEVSRVELDRPGPTYTIDTLAELEEAGELHLIVGADALLGLTTWRQWQDVVRRARVVAVTRPGTALPEGLAGLLPFPFTLVGSAGVAISSTECRERAAAGLPLSYLVPDAVVTYIEQHRLYQEGGA
ncbi:MAG: nicotinate-nucleotide adenylyltransferase [Propionibacteriaceae bacterium]|nr:nicotinate-nucleotide adenylyltransferase [Propionibacteriaceae bacterium]